MAAEPGAIVNHGTNERLMPASVLIHHLDASLMKVKMPQGMDMTGLITADLMG
jgi:hypothetical protein